MLAKQYRLPPYIRIPNKMSVDTPLFVFKAGINTLPHSRFGFVVRKAVDKRATVRNRMRRLIRSCIEEMLPNMAPGIDMLFLLKRPLLEMKREALYNTLYGFLKERQYIS